ncbi:MAG: 30S ribosomal protein S20 [Chloroflexi bacterium RBG_13_52_12]|nr:MAG: 30S ribosomal protein S20 [Chloroflexi bacterium RBG_13_52_12]
MGSKSAQKAARASGRRRERGRAIRSQVKTTIDNAEKLITKGDIEAARVAVATAVSTLDKAAEKKILHGNNAARHKSRLLKKLAKAPAKPQAESKPKAEPKPKVESKAKAESKTKADSKAKAEKAD